MDIYKKSFFCCTKPICYQLSYPGLDLNCFVCIASNIKYYHYNTRYNPAMVAECARACVKFKKTLTTKPRFEYRHGILE